MLTQSEDIDDYVIEVEFVERTCDVCGCRFLSDGDTVCDDRACQEYRWAGIEHDHAVRCAEQILDEAWAAMVAERWGL